MGMPSVTLRDQPREAISDVYCRIVLARVGVVLALLSGEEAAKHSVT